MSKLQKYIKIHLSHVAEHCSIVPIKPDSAFLHISRDNGIKEFIPFVSDRTAKTEDRSVPRVCGARHLVGCMAGYFVTLDDFMDRARSEDWKGGYYIYDLPVVEAISPASELVPDVEVTDEVWAVGYDETHRKLKPTIIGKVFIASIISIATATDPRHTANAYIHAQADLWLDKNTQVRPGYYRAILRYFKGFIVLDGYDEITANEYRGVKNASVSLLSFNTTLSPSHGW